MMEKTVEKWTVELDQKKWKATIYDSSSRLLAEITGEDCEKYPEFINKMRKEIVRNIDVMFGEKYSHELLPTTHLSDDIFELPVRVYERPSIIKEARNKAKKPDRVHKVQFSEEAPTEPGYYWFIPENEEEPEIVQVIREEKQIWAMGFGRPTSPIDKHRYKVGSWSLVPIWVPEITMQKKTEIKVDHEDW